MARAAGRAKIGADGRETAAGAGFCGADGGAGAGVDVTVDAATVGAGAGATGATGGAAVAITTGARGTGVAVASATGWFGCIAGVARVPAALAGALLADPDGSGGTMTGAAPGDEAGSVATGIGVLEPLPEAEEVAFPAETGFETLFCDAELATAASLAGENA